MMSDQLDKMAKRIGNEIKIQVHREALPVDGVVENSKQAQELTYMSGASLSIKDSHNVGEDNPHPDEAHVGKETRNRPVSPNVDISKASEGQSKVPDLDKEDIYHHDGIVDNRDDDKVELVGQSAAIYEPLGVTMDVLQFREDRYKAHKNRPPRDGMGENGVPVVLSPEDQKIADDLFRKATFNIFASDRIAMDRSLPDTRLEECRSVSYPDDLPTASVITIFHNEARSAILRTAHSVVNRSPPRFLKEVLLVDDGSTKDDLKVSLDQYVESTWPDGIVKVLRIPQRSGLIRARMFGMRAATGSVLIVLDAHCEANVDWLEPILTRIKEDRKVVVAPVVDDIRDKTLAYVRNGGQDGIGLGGFYWDLEHVWLLKHPNFVMKDRTSPTDPYVTPVLIGCAFAVEKTYFFEMGGFDEGMEIWGGENIELPIRIWMCGGRVEALPCSRVGHLYRSRAPYTNPAGHETMGKNTKRAVEVWFDDYKQYFYETWPQMLQADPGDLSSRVALREKLGCHDFKWFLDNVYPWKFVPENHLLIAKGFVKNEASRLCLDTMGAAEKLMDIPVKLFDCQPGGKSFNQLFYLTKHGELRKDMRCMETSGREGAAVWLRYCEEVRANDRQEWNYDPASRAIIHVLSGRCVDVEGMSGGQDMVVKNCNRGRYQQWILQKFGEL